MSRKPELDAMQSIHFAEHCIALHVLPGPGGLFEQDYLKVWLIDLVRDAQQEKDRREQAAEEAKIKAKRR